MTLKLGAEPKKVAVLLGLLAVAGFVYVMNSDPAPPPSSSTGKAPATPPPPTAKNKQERLNARTEIVKQKRTGSRSALRTTQEFKPSLKPDKDNPIDPMQADPTLQFARLQRVQSIGLQGTGRNLFDFSGGGGQPVTMEGPKIAVNAKPVEVFPRMGPDPPPKPTPPPPKPPPPPIPLKFYGFINSPRQGGKRAFFMEGEDIFIGGEGDMLKGRYKIVRIGVNSAVLEDTQHENNRQTLPLTEESQNS